MKLYMVRHGESVCNAEDRFSGWSSTPLAETGREDAVRAGRILKGTEFDRVYCSDLPRAQETMALAMPNAEARIDPRLREIRSNILEGRLVAECLEEYGEALSRDRKARDFRAYGGESSEQQRDRLERFLRDLEKEPCEKAAAFCHGGTIQCMLWLVTGEKPFGRVVCDNGSVSVFEWKDGRWRLLAWNYTGALP